MERGSRASERAHDRIGRGGRSTSVRGILHQGKLAGYGGIRRCREGFKIGPLFAETSKLAEILYQALSTCVSSGAALYLDVSKVNPAGIALAERHHMQATSETARM